MSVGFVIASGFAPLTRVLVVTKAPKSALQRIACTVRSMDEVTKNFYVSCPAPRSQRSDKN